MKNIYLILTMFAIKLVSFGQQSYTIDFDSPWSANDHIYIDTVSNPNNIWQIGTPSKTVFNSAYSPTKAIMTDTSNVYPINDTSIFYIRHSCLGKGNELMTLSFYFKINTDSLSDYGSVDVSLDHGYTWINILTEDTTYYIQWLAPKPILTGSSNGWQNFAINMNQLQMMYWTDSIYYRFTFISDSIQTNKDGWMLDDFQINDVSEAVENKTTNEVLTIYPIPSKGILNINTSDFINNNKMTIFNNTGQIVFESFNYKNTQIDLSNLDNGFYYIKYSYDKQALIQKFIISK